LFSLTGGNGYYWVDYVHEGASHRFVMRGLEEEEVGSNSGWSLVWPWPSSVSTGKPPSCEFQNITTLWAL